MPIAKRKKLGKGTAVTKKKKNTEMCASLEEKKKRRLDFMRGEEKEGYPGCEGNPAVTKRRINESGPCWRGGEKKSTFAQKGVRHRLEGKKPTAEARGLLKKRKASTEAKRRGRSSREGRSPRTSTGGYAPGHSQAGKGSSTRKIRKKGKKKEIANPLL